MSYEVEEGVWRDDPIFPEGILQIEDLMCFGYHELYYFLLGRAKGIPYLIVLMEHFAL